MISVRRICTKCGADVLEDAPQGSCSACLLETGLALLADDGAAPQSATPLLAEFGDYELLQEIGRGGQGVVYRARQKSLNRTVALKVIGLGHWAATPHLKRFRQEAEAAASLDHPRIIPIYEIGERDGSCYFSMKLVEGGPLDAAVRREPMSLRRAAELLVKLARTVQYAHEHGILHRDIKPGNILLDEKGEPHLTDFGLARLVENESTITNSFDVLGTPSYMAPEQAAGQTKAFTPATDIYALGAVLYQMLTGQSPFAGGTTFETIRMVLETEPRRPRLWNSKIDRELETICLKCLEKEPQKRYASAELLAQDLEHWLRHEPIRARRSGIVVRSRKWIRRNRGLAVAILFGLALVTALALMLWNGASDERPPVGIAVLPFENLSEGKEDASLADTIQDDLLTKLGKIASLKVISRTSTMAYRGERNIRKIGRALRVSHVVEGSVHRVDGRVRVNAQLIDAQTDTHVWAETYERSRSDLFALESDLAKEVAARLATKVSFIEKAAIEAKPTNDLEAYELYVRAKAFTQLLLPDDPAALDKHVAAVELLEKAVARDPNFALAYCLLTEGNLNLYWVAGRVEATRRTRAEAALRAAQRLAPDAGETHLANALFYYYGERDFDRALEQLEIAGRLLPNNADVLRTTGRLERRLNRWKEALRHFVKATELDPRQPVHLINISLTYRLLRHYREAEQTADRGLASFPEAADQFWREKAEVALDEGDLEKTRTAVEKFSNSEAFPMFLITVFLHERNYAAAERVAIAQWTDEAGLRFTGWSAVAAARAEGDDEKMRTYALKARAAYEGLLDTPATEPVNLSEAGLLDVALGRRENGIAECRRAVELCPISRDALNGAECAVALAVAYAWSGERDRAIEQLRTVANVANGPSYGDLKFSPLWDSLRDDPRFEKILAEAAKPLPL